MQELLPNFTETEDRLTYMQGKGTELAKLVDKRIELDHEIEKLNEQIKVISEHELPAIMTELGITCIKLTGGGIIEINDFIKVTPKDKGLAYKWLNDNGHGGVVKKEVVVDVGRDTELHRRITEALDGFMFKTKEDVHHMTLNSLAKELNEQGVTFPENLFTTYKGQSVSFR
jgi:uncharacterized protein YdcH (DUF465 family)